MADENDDKPIPKPRAADSMEAAAATLAAEPVPEHRLTLDDLKRAKRAGCPAFRGSRVVLDDLLEWWDENHDTLPTGDDELDKINLEIAREKLRKVRFAQDVEEGKFIRKEEAAPLIEALGIELKNTLERRLVEEAPDRLANRSREEIATFNKTLVDDLCTHFQKHAARWAKK